MFSDATELAVMSCAEGTVAGMMLPAMYSAKFG